MWDVTLIASRVDAVCVVTDLSAEGRYPRLKQTSLASGTCVDMVEWQPLMRCNRGLDSAGTISLTRLVVEAMAASYARFGCRA